MWRSILIMTLVCAIALPVLVAVAQDAEKKADAPEKPVAAKPAVRASELIEKLGAEDFAVRKQAERDIMALGKDALPALDKAAEVHADAHVRFEAAKLAKRIRALRPGEKALAEPGAGGAKPDDRSSAHRRRLEEMIRRLEAQGLLDEEQLERLRKALEDGGPAVGFGLQPPSGGSMQGHAVTGDRRIDFQRDGEGRVTVKITEGGETKTYEADSMEELEKKAPEVHALVQKHFGNVQVKVRPFGFGFGWPGRDWPDWPEMPGFPRRPPETKREVPLRERKADVPGGFRMGIWVGEVSEALRTHLKLAKDEGVLVAEVVKGSLADRIGLERLDVIRRLNGTPVLTAAAVRAAVEKVAEGGKVTAEIIRKGDPLTLVGTR